MSETPLRIKRVSLEGLFRTGNDLRIDLNQKERVSILHGRNGVGKTSTLSLLNALKSGNYSRFQDIPLAKLELTFTDGSIFRLTPASSLGDARGATTSKRKKASRVSGGTLHDEPALMVVPTPDGPVELNIATWSREFSERFGRSLGGLA